MLRDLSRKELVRPSRRSSMQGEAEYAFWHILTRDVAYTPAAPRLTRGPPRRRRDLDRSRRPPTAWKTWLTCSPTTTRPPSTSPTPPEQADQAATLEDPARRFLTLAGQRALGLDTTAALTNLERALALTPEGHPDRAQVLVSFAKAALHAGRTSEAKQALEEAIPILQARGDLRSPSPRHEHAQHRAQRPCAIHAGQSSPQRPSHCWNHSHPAPP